MFFRVPAGASSSGAMRFMVASFAKAAEGKRLVPKVY
jgi:hypothetical protein